MDKKYFDYYGGLSDEEISRRNSEKEDELRIISEKEKLGTDSGMIRIAVLGCPDKRSIGFYREIFEKIFQKKSEVIIFDIATDHLNDDENVFRNDCVESIPHGPYDIVYSHVLLKFIETKKQFKLLMNSYDVLKSGGMAIHILDKEDYSLENTDPQDGYFPVPLDEWKNKLKEKGMVFEEIPVKYGIAVVMKKE